MTVGVCIHWTFRAASTLDLFEVGDLLTAALQSPIAMTGGERMSMLPTGLETTRMALA